MTRKSTWLGMRDTIPSGLGSSGGWGYPDWDPIPVWFPFTGCAEGGLGGYTVWGSGVAGESIG